MRILNGWKEIGECLNLTSRTAQRWERLGLPVRRVSNSSRSPIVALSDDIEAWVRERRTGHALSPQPQTDHAAFRAARDETRRLVQELKATRIKHQELLEAIRDQIDKSRAFSPESCSQRSSDQS
jgi:hypothetical protein